MADDNWTKVMQKASVAFGCTIVVGARGRKDGSWFATAMDGDPVIEYDGDSPATAVESVVKALVARRQTAAAKATETARNNEAQLATWEA